MDITSGSLDESVSESSLGIYDPKLYTHWGGWLQEVLSQKDNPNSVYLNSLLQRLRVLNTVNSLQAIINGVIAFTQGDLNYLCSDLLDGLWKGVTNLDKGKDTAERFRSGKPPSLTAFLKRTIKFPSVFAFLKERGLNLSGDGATVPATRFGGSRGNNFEEVPTYHVWVGKAVSAGALATVEWLYDQGGILCDLEPLNSAALAGHLPIFQFLHSKGVPLNGEGEAALSWACDYNQLEVARFLLEEASLALRAPVEPHHSDIKVQEPLGGPPGRQNSVPFGIALRRGEMLPVSIEKGHTQIVELLLEYGANPNIGFDAVQKALIKFNRYELIPCLLQARLLFKWTHFEMAVKNRRGEIVVQLRTLGFDVNDKGGYLLAQAIVNQDLDLVKFLFDNGQNSRLTSEQRGCYERSIPPIKEYLSGRINSYRH